MTAPRILSRLFILICAAMIGLAAGAVWLLPTLYSGRFMPWLALPIGWILGRTVRAWVYPSGGAATQVLAAAVTLLACLYQCILLTGARVASAVGMEFIDALRISGLGMLMSITRMNFTGLELAWYVAGIVVAAYAAAPSSRAYPPAAS
ncbi:hypothetical protein [Dyella sp.]|uniref:hypothetical protein n=1 Tax=Dyella sp. TaxID=1869338 RepID=UPI002ED4A6F0